VTARCASGGIEASEARQESPSSTSAAEDAPEQAPPEQGGAAGENPTGGLGENAEATESDGGSEPGGQAAGQAEGKTAGTGATATTGVLTTDERRAGLDRELDASLKEFDELLAREEEDLSKRREETAAQVAASGGGSVPLGSDDGDTSTGGQSTGDSPTGGPGSHPSGANRGGSGGVPASVRDGTDDDIVARQLREAAENEKDPELREKLWQEYRDYKAGLSGKKKPKKPDAGEESKSEEGSSDAEGKDAGDG